MSRFPVARARRRVPQASRVHESQRPARPVEHCFDRVAGRSRDLGDDCARLAEQRVEQRRLCPRSARRRAPRARRRGSACPSSAVASSVAHVVERGSRGELDALRAESGRRPPRESRCRRRAAPPLKDALAKRRATRAERPPSSWWSARRWAAADRASIRSPIASACSRSSLPFSTARRVNSPGSA